MADIPAWSTNFYYEQDLRSLFMNGMYNSSFSPGIYNANMYLFSPPKADADNGGISLFIGKGTTFIFSNNMIQGPQGRWIRNPNMPGEWVIKCVANKDITVEIAKLNASRDTNETSLLGNTEATANNNMVYAPVKWYLTAMMYYQPEQVLPGWESPRFAAVLDNTSFRSKVYDLNDKPEGWEASGVGTAYDHVDINNLYFDPVVDSIDVPIFDGSDTNQSLGLSEDSRKMLSYLMIGQVIDVSKIPSKTAYTTNNDWGASFNNNGEDLSSTITDDNENAKLSWLKNHVFVGRGMPDYRKNYIQNKNTLSPEILPTPLLDRLYLDTNTLYNHDILYQTNVADYGTQPVSEGATSKNNWEDILGIGVDRTSIESHEYDNPWYGKWITAPGLEPNFKSINPREAVYILDRPIDASGNYKGGYVRSSKYEESLHYENSIIKEVVDNWEIYKNTDYIVACDIAFLSTREKYSFTDSLDLHEDEILPDHNNDHNKNLRDIFTSEALKEKFKIIPLRFLSPVKNDSPEIYLQFNPNQNNDKIKIERPKGSTDNNPLPANDPHVYKDSGASLASKYFSTKDVNYVEEIIPLDVSEGNQKRLQDIVKNLNIVPLAIDYIRQHTNESPYLNIKETTSLIPAFIIFRKFLIEKKDISATDQSFNDPIIENNYIYLRPCDSISRDYVKQGSILNGSTENPIYPRFNPANILSFFDLQYKTLQANAIDFKVDNLYSVIPVIE